MTDFPAAVRRAARRVTARVVAVTLAIALAFEVWLLVEMRNLYPTMALGGSLLSATIINLVMAFSIMYSTLVADEWVAAGARRLPAYALAVVIGSAAGALVEWHLHQWIHLLPVNIDTPTPNPTYDVSRDLYQPAVAVTQPAVMFFEFLIWGSIAVFVYVNRRTALLAAARTTAAQVERARAQRRTLESRLQALQARVEPQFLFGTLARVRDLYESDPAKGGRMLDDLIVYLRAALPHLRESSSTLGQELRLVRAYLSIMRMRLHERLAFDIEAPPRALAARVPSLVLLPLVNRLLAGFAPAPAGGTVAIRTEVVGDRLRLELFDDAARTGGGNDVLADIQARLHALHGERGALVRTPVAGGGERITLEIPYEPADGDHR